MSDSNITRRNFLRQAACAALGATAMVNTLAALRLTSAAIAQGNDLDDYKALVCIFLNGGNDSNNLLVPMGAVGGNPVRADYETGRDVLALGNDTLRGLTLPPSASNAFKKHYGGSSSPLGVHPNAPGIANLFNSGDLAFVCNVGTLAYPIPTRMDLLEDRVPVPLDLFSHSDQQTQWQTSVPDNLSNTGWGGRVADLLDAGYNGDSSKVSMSISLSGVNTFQRGLNPETNAFGISPSGTIPLSGFGSPTDPYGNAYHPGASFYEPTYQDRREGHRLKALEQLVKLTSENLLEDAHASKIVSARGVSESVNAAVAAAVSTGVNFDQLFAGAVDEDGGGNLLADQMKMVAQLIVGRSALGNSRQIFFVNVGGYDIHRSHMASHAMLMNELSGALAAFRDALVAAGDWDKVVAYTASDFSRTFTANGSDNDAGTDHAWGGHAMVLGGPVKGGNLYGHFPSLKTGDHPESIDSRRERGRWIPSTSVDQYSAVLAKWFGVDSNSMETIFPNINRFDDPFSVAAANLRFLEGV